jgi:hypothetical protein
MAIMNIIAMIAASTQRRLAGTTAEVLSDGNEGPAQFATVPNRNPIAAIAVFADG